MPVVGLILMGLVQLFYHRTAYGKQLKAVAWNPEAAGLMGINIPRAVMASYALSALLAGVAGVLLAPLLNVAPQMGTIIGLKAFAVAIIGGLTSAPGIVRGRVRLRARGVLHRRLRLDAGARDRGIRPRDPRARGEAVGIARREALEAGVSERFGWAALAIAAAIVPLLTSNTYYLYVASGIGLLTIVTAGLNVLVGFTGQTSLGHAGLYAFGAYGAALCATRAA